MWQNPRCLAYLQGPSFCTGQPSEANPLDEWSVRCSTCPKQPSARRYVRRLCNATAAQRGETVSDVRNEIGASGNARRLEITTGNADGIECEITRLLFEEGVNAILNADSIADGQYMFMSLTVTAKHFTAEMWDKLRQKLLRMVRLSSVSGLCNPSDATKVRCLPSPY
jgi:hypothetical protein